MAEDEYGDDVDDDPGQVHLSVSAAAQVVPRKSANIARKISFQCFFNKIFV